MDNYFKEIKSSLAYWVKVAHIPFKKLFLVYGCALVVVIGGLAWQYRYGLLPSVFPLPGMFQVAPKAALSLTPSSKTDVQLGQTFVAQVSLTPNHPVIGVDVILNYDPTYLQVQSLTKASGLPFGTFISATDQAKHKIMFSALAYDGSKPTTPVSGSSSVPLANITFLALAPGNTTITFEYSPNSTIDSNVSIIENKTAIDILEQPVTQLPVNITTAQPSPSPSPRVSPSPSPSPSPTPRVSPSPSPRVSPSPSPSPSPRVSPLPSPSPSPSPAARGMLVNLEIDLEVKGDDSNEEVRVQLKQDGAVKGETKVPVDSEGKKSEVRSDLPSGRYHLVVKPIGYLSRAIDMDLIVDTAINAIFSQAFLAGDLNENSYNLVNSLDYAIFVNRYRSSDKVADFNGDGQINSLDYSIFVRNYNKAGEE